MWWVVIFVILILSFGVLSQSVLSKQPPMGGNWITNAYTIGLKSGSLWEKFTKICEECTRNGGILLYLPYFYETKSRLEQQYLFVPFAVETAGPWCGEAKTLVLDIGRCLRDRGLDPRSESYLVQHISLAIQRGNAAGVMGTFESVVTDPEVLQSFMNFKFEKGMFFHFVEPWLGSGLFAAPVPLWKAHRKLLNPAFNQHFLNELLPTFNQQAKRLVQRWADSEKKIFNPFPDLAMFNLDTLCMSLFGFKEDEKTLQEYIHTVEELNTLMRYRFERFWLFSDYIYRWTTAQKKEKECIRIVRRFSYKVIQKRKEAIEEITEMKMSTDMDASKKKLLIDRLFELESLELYTKNQVRAEINTFLFGGYDSLSTTTFLTLMLLGSYPDVQEKVYQEIEQVVGSSEDVQKEDLLKLVYLEAVIKESMRFYPFAPYSHRKIYETIKLKDYTIPRGSNIFLLFYGTHRHPLWGADAHIFRPERWLQPESLPTNPVAYLAFSWGKRACIGKLYAMMHLKTTLVHLLRNFKVKADHTKLKFELEIVLKVVAGNHVSFERRL